MKKTWRYEKERQVLIHEGRYYEIDLDRCQSSAAILDWIFQINGKTWTTPETMKDLLDLIEEVLNPQAYFCSWGTEQSQKTKDSWPWMKGRSA